MEKKREEIKIVYSIIFLSGIPVVHEMFFVRLVCMSVFYESIVHETLVGRKLALYKNSMYLYDVNCVYI